MNVFLVLILFFGICFVSSEEPNWPGKDLGYPEGLITGDVTITKVGNLNKITIGKGPVTIGKGSFKNMVPGGEINLKGNKIVEADFFTNAEGGIYTFGNTEINAPPNSRVIFDEKSGIAMEVLKGSEITKMPRSKDGFLPSKYVTKIEGENIKLPSGDILNSGTMYVGPDGQTYIDLDDRTTINGVEIGFLKLRSLGVLRPLKGIGLGKLDVYFDGLEHEGDYASFGLKDGRFFLGSESDLNPVAVFTEGNPFVRIQKGDWVAAQPSFPGATFSIQNNDLQGDIPTTICKGKCWIDQDFKSISMHGDGRFEIFPTGSTLGGSSRSTTSPMTFFSQDIDGNNLLKGNSKIFVDNFNRIAIGPDVGEFIASFEGIDVKMSERIHYNYPTEESIRALTGAKINYNRDIIGFRGYWAGIPEGSRDMVLGKLRDYVKAKGLGNNIMDGKIINFVSDSYMNQVSRTHVGCLNCVGAFFEPGAKSGTASLNFRANQNRFNFDNFVHELTHLQEDTLKQQSVGKLPNAFRTYSMLKFEWLEANRNQPYDSRLTSGGYLYNDGTPDIHSKHGFVSPYGGSSFSEDMATYASAVNTPNNLEPLLDPKSSTYDPRYMEKIRILHNYGFISPKQYEEVLNVVEVNK